MNNHDDILTLLKTALEKSLNVIVLKENIENEIISLFKLIEKSTNNIVCIEIKNQPKADTLSRLSNSVSSYDKAVILNNRENDSIKNTLCAYTINRELGFPVLIKYDDEEFSCNDISALKITLRNIITHPKSSMMIANIFKGQDACY